MTPHQIQRKAAQAKQQSTIALAVSPSSPSSSSSSVIENKSSIGVSEAVSDVEEGHKSHLSESSRMIGSGSIDDSVVDEDVEALVGGAGRNCITSAQPAGEPDNEITMRST